MRSSEKANLSNKLDIIQALCANRVKRLCCLQSYGQPSLLFSSLLAVLRFFLALFKM